MYTLGMLLKAFNQIHHPHFAHTRSSMNFFQFGDLVDVLSAFHTGIHVREFLAGVSLRRQQDH